MRIGSVRQVKTPGGCYTFLKGQYLPLDQLYDFERFIEQGYPPSEAYKLCKQISA